MIIFILDISMKMNKCNNQGCQLAFKHRVQLRRHRLKCTKSPPPQNKKINIEKTNGDRFSCPDCKKVVKYKNNVYKHQNICKKTPHKPVHHCHTCGKDFQYASKLAHHMSSHEKKDTAVYICDKCDKCYARKKYFDEHLCGTISYPPSFFVPRFCCRL